MTKSELEQHKEQIKLTYSISTASAYSVSRSMVALHVDASES